MSHIVQIRTQVKDPVAAIAACRRLGLPVPVEETEELFAGKATGLAVPVYQAGITLRSSAERQAK